MELWNTIDGTATPAGEAFRFLEGLLAQADTIARVTTDDFTHFYTFGRHAAVVWGKTGAVTLAPGVHAYDLEGNYLAEFNGRLSAERPIVLMSDGDISASSLRFHAGTLVADSFDQFDVTNTDAGGGGFEGSWSYFSLSGTGQIAALQTMGGGLKSGEPWTPYLGSQWLRPFAVDATTVTPADFSGGLNPASRYAVVERYTVPVSGVFTIAGDYDVADHSRDGIYLTVTVNQRQMLNERVYDPAQGNRLRFSLDHVSLVAGDKVEFVVSSGSDAIGDKTARHIQIFLEPAVVRPSIAADFSDAKAGVRLELDEASAVVDGEKIVVGSADAIGSDYNDVLWGDARGNRLEGGAGDDRLSGLEGDDVLSGGNGADRLDGGRGADRMEGGSGDDTYQVDDAGDIVMEGADGGIDTVRSEVDFVLGDHIERLYLTGSSAIAGTGNGLANILYGNAGDNLLSGRGGADKLEGGSGADIFLFDMLEGARAADTIMDFAPGADRIALDRSAFASLSDRPAGELDDLGFGKKATSADMHLFYDAAPGTLYYDADGSGAAAAVALANLRGKPMIDATDVFFV